MISSYYPFIVEKGKAFRLYLHFSVGASSTPSASDITNATITPAISKDGGAWSLCTNSVVKIAKNDSLGVMTYGSAYIDLTATEMNADNVLVSYSISGASQNTEPPTFLIKTGKLNPVLDVLDRRLKRGNQKL
jgi:hypothetical protein